MGFTPQDLLWVKNVKRNKGKDCAYLEYDIGSVFNLNWSRRGLSNANKVPANQLILLFQTVNNGVGGYKRGTYLTHIVTPLNGEQAYLNHRNRSHPVERKVIVIAKPTIQIPKPQNLSFQEPNRGMVCDLNKIKPLKKNERIRLNRLQQLLWDLFEDKDANIRNINSENYLDTEDEYSGTEGAERFAYRRHKYYERDPKVIALAKEHAKENGRFFCEICKFDFYKIYKDHGFEFIECHHKNPIASGGIRNTTIADLALVCANCHRMLHRRTKDLKYLTVDELTNLIK